MKKKWMSIALAGMVIGTLISGCGGKEKELELPSNSQVSVEHTDKKAEKDSPKSKEEKTITLSNGRKLDFPYTDRNLGFKMMVLKEERYGMPIDSNLTFHYGGFDSDPECEFIIGPYKYRGDNEYASDAKMCDLKAIKGSEDILDNMAYKIVESYEGLNQLKELTKESIEKVTLAGFEGTKWRGEITVTTSSGPFVYGYVAYGFIGSDGRPYLFAGTDFTEERKQMSFMEEAWEGMLSTFVENPLPEGVSLTVDKTYSDGEWWNY